MRSDLAGIRVIAVEQAVAAPICSRHLADLGADVIKVERPDGGDFARHYDGTVLGWSSHFVWLNGGKRSIVLDLKSPEGVAALKALLAEADVLVCNLAPGAFDRIIADEVLEELNPRLIRCHISGYGQRGPYAGRKAYDALVQGEAGTTRATGTPEHPAKPGVSLADVGGGVYALSSILAALIERHRTGRGKRVEVSLFDVLIEWMSPLLLTQRYTNSAPPPSGLRHASIAPYGPFQCADGSTLLIAVQNEGQWRRLCAGVLDDRGLADHPDFVTNELRLRNRQRLELDIQAVFGRLARSTAVILLEEADIPYGALNGLDEVLEHPQAAANGRWSRARLGDGETVVVATPPFYSGSDDDVVRRVPILGEHTEELIGALQNRIAFEE